MRTNARCGDREELDPHRFRKRFILDFAPELVEVEQALGHKEGGDDLLKRGAFFFGEVEGDTGPEAVDQPISNLRGDDLVAQTVSPNRLFMCLAHRFGKGVEKLRLYELIL